MLLTEFDESKQAVINPDMMFHKVPDFPETLVSVFSHQLFKAVLDFLGGKVIAETADVDGIWPVYEVTYKGKRFAFYKARLGAPACVGCFEDVIPMGVKRIILLGNCGVLDSNIKDCGIIIPTKAIRDEGTSYHYAPAADYIDVNKKYVDEFVAVKLSQNHRYGLGCSRCAETGAGCCESVYAPPDSISKCVSRNSAQEQTKRSYPFPEFL